MLINSGCCVAFGCTDRDMVCSDPCSKWVFLGRTIGIRLYSSREAVLILSTGCSQRGLKEIIDVI